MSSRMMTAFSDEQEVALSKIFDAQILCAASARSALESIITGTLPGPTPMVTVPDFMARRTLFWLPVTTTRSLWSIKAWVNALSTGGGRIWTRSSGWPALRSSCRIRRTVSIVVFWPAGDGAMMTALPPFKAIMDLLTGVAAGLVDGQTAPTTPTGLPYFTIPRSGRSSITPTVRTRIRSRRVPKVLRVFLIALLSTLPRPVSSTASSASIRACAGL